MDHIKIKGSDWRSLQHRAHAADHNEIDVVRCQTTEDGQEIRFGGFHAISLWNVGCGGVPEAALPGSGKASNGSALSPLRPRCGWGDSHGKESSPEASRAGASQSLRFWRLDALPDSASSAS